MQQILPMLLAPVQAGNISKIFWTRLDKLLIYCIGQNNFHKKYKVVYSNQYNEKYNIREFREQQDLWRTQPKALSHG